MRIHLVTIGDELLLGKTQNTHVAYIGRKLAENGMELSEQSTIQDDSGVMDRFLRRAVAESDLVIATGGLGPTGDDNTKNVLAGIFGRSIGRDERILDDLTERYGRVSEAVKTQADVPEDTTILMNRVGTAPGFIFADGKMTVVCLPGPPREMEPMFEEQVLPYLAEHFGGRGVFVSRTLRTIGIRESDVAGEVAEPLGEIEGLIVGYCAHTFNVDVRISARSGNEDEANRLLDRGERIVREKVGEFIYADRDEEIEVVLGRVLRERGLTLAVAESCTGGLIGSRITDAPGSSDYFLGGMVSYSNEWKMGLLGAPEKVIEEHGAVSEETARVMAERIREISGASIGLSSTGIAGPSGGTKEKPVGLVYIGLCDEAGSAVTMQRFGNRNRELVKRLTSQAALAFLWRRLQG